MISETEQAVAYITYYTLHITMLNDNIHVLSCYPFCPQGHDFRTAEARAVALRAEADAELGARMASFPRDPLGARLYASLQELQHPARKTARPPAKRPPRKPFLERSDVKVRGGCAVVVRLLPAIVLCRCQLNAATL